MTTTLRPRLIGLISTLTLAAGAAVITSLTQAGASDLPPFACTSGSGGTAAAAATVTWIRVAHHDGYDRLVLGFATSNAVPEYQLQRQSSSTFIRDASGQSVALDGSAGVKVVLQNTDIASGVPSDLRPALPELREVRNTGNFERVVSYGVGLANGACLRVFQLTSPSRLVIDVQTPATTEATVPAATASAADAAALPQDLALTGHPAEASPPSSLPLAAIAIGLLAAATGMAIAGWYRFMRR